MKTLFFGLYMTVLMLSLHSKASELETEMVFDQGMTIIIVTDKSHQTIVSSNERTE